jgi:hypothetical protein
LSVEDGVGLGFVAGWENSVTKERVEAVVGDHGAVQWRESLSSTQRTREYAQWKGVPTTFAGGLCRWW